MITTTIRISNTKDYPLELMEKLIKTQTTEHVIERASWTHFYVVEDKESIVGYQYKNGIKEPDDEHLIRMEKFR